MLRVRRRPLVLDGPPRRVLLLGLGVARQSPLGGLPRLARLLLRGLAHLDLELLVGRELDFRQRRLLDPHEVHELIYAHTAGAVRVEPPPEALQRLQARFVRLQAQAALRAVRPDDALKLVEFEAVVLVRINSLEDLVPAEVAVVPLLGRHVDSQYQIPQVLIHQRGPALEDQ